MVILFKNQDDWRKLITKVYVCFISTIFPLLEINFHHMYHMYMNNIFGLCVFPRELVFSELLQAILTVQSSIVRTADWPKQRTETGSAPLWNLLLRLGIHCSRIKGWMMIFKFQTLLKQTSFAITIKIHYFLSSYKNI